MNKGQRIFSCFLAFIPLAESIAYMVVWLIIVRRFIINNMQEGSGETILQDYMNVFASHAAVFIIAFALLVLVNIGILIYFILQCLNNPRVNATERIIWIVLFVFTGVIAKPVYWFMRVMDNGENTASNTPRNYPSP